MPTIPSETITLAISEAVSAINPVPTVSVVAVREKFSLPMYRSSLYSTNEVTEPRLSSVSLTTTEATEVSVWVPDPVLVISIVDPPCVADKVSSSAVPPEPTVFT